MIVLVDYASPSVFEFDARCDHGRPRRPTCAGPCASTAACASTASSCASRCGRWARRSGRTTPGSRSPTCSIPSSPCIRDRIFFEAFSQDQSAYVALIVDPAVFEPMGEVVTGTTNIDFTAWLWGALGEMRTSRSHDLPHRPRRASRCAPSGAGGRFEKKVELPETWVRGFLQVQAAMAMPGTRLAVKPIDLLGGDPLPAPHQGQGLAARHALRVRAGRRTPASCWSRGSTSFRWKAPSTTTPSPRPRASGGAGG